jgi:hypothetical protein
MLASGCVIKDKPEEASYVVEVRAGSVGTNRQDLLFGVPSTTLPTAGLLPVGAATIPEIALVKRTNQQGVCKIAVFAYDRMSGRPVWQSGNRKVASRAKDIWVAGAGPFQRGTIYDGTAFAGEKFGVPLVKKKQEMPERLTVGREKVFLHDLPPGGLTEQGGQVENAGYMAKLPNNAQPLPSSTPPPATDAKPADASPPKAAYTPPLPPPIPAPPPPPPPAGPQGNLSSQTVLPTNGNPAAATAGAIQMFNWAKDFSDRSKQ